MGIVRTRVKHGVVAAALVLGSLFAVGLAPANLAADASELSYAASVHARALSEARAYLLSLTNADRAAGDRRALELADRLSRYATRHSRRMAELGYLFHSGDQQLRDAFEGTTWSVAGENVGVGSSVQAVERAFMASAPHRSNILDGAWDHAAIGVVRSGGVVWITVIFYGA